MPLARAADVIRAHAHEPRTPEVTLMHRTAVQSVGILLLCAALAATACAADYVWWEAEDFTESNWPGGKSGEGTFAPKDEQQRASFSGDVWLNAQSRDETLYMAYALDLPEPGEYTFYARVFGDWQSGTRTQFRIRFGDDTEWRTFRNREGVTLHKAKPLPYVTLAWVRLAKVNLPAGKLDVRVETIDNEDVVAFDCFVLASGGFHPDGILKPGEKLGLAMDGWWAFEPDADPFKDGSYIDLSHLNEDIAGQNGYMRLSDDGERFVLGDDTPVRLWSVEVSAGQLALEDLRAYAKFLAKRGVNAIRIFNMAPDPSRENDDPNSIDEQARDELWKAVAAFRDEGIYVFWTPFWTYSFDVHKTWNWPYFDKWNWHKKPDGAIFFHEEFQEAYKEWVRQFLLPENPYTGVPLARDPALYCIQFQNEQSVLFWTGLSGCPEGLRREANRQFEDWLANKYGSIEKAFGAWGQGAPIEGYDVAAGQVSIPGPWPMSGRWEEAAAAKEPAMAKRSYDAIQFIAEHVRAFHHELTDFYRDEIGYAGLLSANNWKSADPITLDDVERYTYTTNEVIDAHHYYGALHVNPNQKERASYAVDAGDYFVDTSCLLEPRKLPTVYKMIAGHPHVMSESTWVSPRSYQSEGPLLIACYGALTGLDMYNWFASGGWQWDTGVAKFQMANPCIQGQFPAAALLYRKGYVRESEPVVYEARRLEDMWRKRNPLLAEHPQYDPTVNKAYIGEDVDVEGGLDPLAFLAGAVRVEYDADPAGTKVADLGRCIDGAEHVVNAVTGEMGLDYGTGVFTVDAPRAQGVAGFLGRIGRFELSDVVIESRNEYATVVVVPLDDRPIRESARLLVQVGTTCRPYGWQEKEAEFDANLHGGGKPDMRTGSQIVSLGGPPWNVVATRASITVANSGLSRATLLDANGYPVRGIEASAAEGRITVELPPDALYVALE